MINKIITQIKFGDLLSKTNIKSAKPVNAENVDLSENIIKNVAETSHETKIYSHLDRVYSHLDSVYSHMHGVRSWKR